MNDAPANKRWQGGVPQSGVGQRLDVFLAETVPGASRKAVKRALDRGQVFVDGRVERRAGRVLAGGEELAATIVAAPLEIPPPALAVIYRDAALLAVNKPPGLPAHPTVAGRANALDLVRDLLGDKAEPILLHRLDADTSGVLLFALSASSNRALAADFAERQVVKRYLALAGGVPGPAFSVSNHLRAGVRGRTVAVASGGQAAHTDFRTLGLGPGFALVEALPHTGRTHQIRVHLAGSGFPLLGDTLYGGVRTLGLADGQVLVAPRHLLHAHSLEFTHPQEKRPLRLVAPLFPDFQPFLDCVGHLIEI